MPQNVFKVVFSKKELPVIIACFLIMGTLLFFVNIIISFIVFILAIFTICANLLFYVQVNESNVKVRTRSGRKYEFNTSDIEKVICTIESTLNMGSFFYITIIAKSKELSMECRMVGFHEMVGYILEKYENGEINEQAISEDCRNELYQYKELQ